MSISDKSVGGHGVQVVNQEDHTFTLDTDALKSILLRQDIKDRGVVLVSVAGAYRKGKSFLLDFFIRYLRHTYGKSSGGGEWIGAEDEPLSGFNWRGGAERDTTGLLLWSEPFLTTLDNGDQVVILLMDTQGTFDSESTMKDNMTVFALSTMLSSVQIYNLSQNIEEDDLQHLQFFTDYGREAQRQEQRERPGKPFQWLNFLVRDWSYPYDHKYGAAGGHDLLLKRLEVHPDQHEQLQALRRHITSCFDKLDCFLMPHPGLKVATSPDFNGRLSDISAEFKASLNDLVPMFLAPKNLAPKVMYGHKVRAKELFIYFQKYIDVFNSDELPSPKSLYEANAEAHNLTAVAQARDIYDKLMGEVCGGSYLPPARLEEEHLRIKNKVLLGFDSALKTGGKELIEKYRGELVEDLDEQYEMLRTQNEAKNIFAMAGTPVALGALALLGYLLSVLGGVLGLQTMVALGQMLTITTVAMLALWGYSRISGNMRDIAVQIDGVALNITNYVRGMRDPVGQQALGHRDDKKHT